MNSILNNIHSKISYSILQTKIIIIIIIGKTHQSQGPRVGTEGSQLEGITPVGVTHMRAHERHLDAYQRREKAKSTPVILNNPTPFL